MATQKLGDIVISKQAGTVLTLATEQKYVASDVYFTIAASQGVATTAATVDVSATDDANSTNIYDVIGTKSSSAPVTGYYFKMDASGTGSSTITTAGWFDTGTLGTASTSGAFYFPVQTATASASGTNTVTPSASVAGTNVTLSNVNNGVSVTATGGGSAEATVVTISTQAGYVPNATQLATGTASASSTTTTASSFIAGITLNAPASGINQFAITLPNGSDMITLTFKVSSDGSWVVE